MNASEALARLRRLGIPAISIGDAAAALDQTSSATSMTLGRLASAGLVTKIRHGLFWIDGDIDRLRLPEFLTAPFPSYVSLHTALHVRGLVEQIPEIVYAVTLGRTRRVDTSVGTFSFHHVAPQVYGGFDETPSGVRLATAEKALFDVAYLAGGRSRLFAALPELELPRAFRVRELDRWLARIPSKRARTLTRQHLDDFLARSRAA